MTVEMYAERKGWDVGALEVDVDVAYEAHAPRSFEVTLRLPAGLDDGIHPTLEARLAHWALQHHG